mgnify:FL=1
MNFNDRDNLTILYYQIFVKDIKPEKLGIDYVRLERLYNDPKTLKKYKIIIKDILRSTGESKLFTYDSRNTQLTNTSDKQDRILTSQGSRYHESDLLDLCTNINFNRSLVYNFDYLKQILIVLNKCESINYGDLQKINQLIKTLIVQSVFAKKPELEFVILRNLILIIIKYGIFNGEQQTGLINLDIKNFLSLTTNVEFQNNISDELFLTYIIDSRLEVIYLLMKNNFDLCRVHYYTLLKCLRNKPYSKNAIKQPPELKIKWIKLITNLIIENKLHISEKLFETKLLTSFLKLIPEINIDLEDVFIQELINSIRLLLEHFCPSLKYIKEDDNFINLQQLIEISDVKDGTQYKDKVNINLLKIMIIVGIDLHGYAYKRVVTLFEKTHLAKLNNRKYQLSTEYQTLILKTVFYIHKWTTLNVVDMDNDLVKIYNEIDDKRELDDCPSPIIYNKKYNMETEYKDVALTIEDMGKVNTIFLRSEKEMGFVKHDLVDKVEEKKILYVTQIPESIPSDVNDAFVDNQDENIEDEFDSLKLEFKEVEVNKPRLFSNTSEAKKSSVFSMNIKKSRFFSKK